MSDQPYRPPSELIPPEHLLRPERGRGVALAAVLLMLAATLLSAVVVLMVAGSFGTLAEAGQSDPTELAHWISLSMWTTLLGMLTNLIGGILGLMAVFGAGNRERWFFFVGLFIAFLQLVTFPLGTLFGILLLVGFFIKRGEFLAVRHSSTGDTET